MTLHQMIRDALGGGHAQCAIVVLGEVGSPMERQFSGSLQIETMFVMQCFGKCFWILQHKGQQWGQIIIKWATFATRRGPNLVNDSLIW